MEQGEPVFYTVCLTEANRITRAQPTLKQVTRNSQAIAKRVGLSRATYERIKMIIIKGSEDQKNALRGGKVVGINKIYRQLRYEENLKATLRPRMAQQLLQSQEMLIYGYIIQTLDDSLSDKYHQNL